MYTSNYPYLAPSESQGFMAKMADENFGMFVATGTTGSGKTSALMDYIMSFSENIRVAIVADFPGEYTRLGRNNTITIKHDLYARGQGLSGVEAIRAALRTQPSVLVYDAPTDGQVISALTMASLTMNTAISIYAKDFIGSMARMRTLLLEDKDCPITPSGFFQSLKGILVGRLVENRWYQECLETSTDVLDMLLSMEKMDDDTVQGQLELYSQRQGYSLAMDQRNARF